MRPFVKHPPPGRASMKLRSPILRAAVLAALVPAFAAGCGTSTAAPAPASSAAAGASAPAAATQNSAHGAPDFTQLVKQAGPAVVNISVTKDVQASEQEMPSDDDDPMSQFFRRFGVP